MASSEHSGTSHSAAFNAAPFLDQEAARQSFARVSAKLSKGLSHALPSLFAESPDPDSALLLFDRFLSEITPEVLRLLDTHPFLAHYAIAVFGHSWYLGETLIRNPDLLQGFVREKRLDRSFSREEFSEALARFHSRSFERDGSLLLARFKRREYVRIMLRDVLRIAPLAETVAEISALSDVLIEEALREAASDMEHRYGLPHHLDPEGRTVNTPFSVLALGKLGGNELNYSSDIDLLFLFGDGTESTAAPISNREYFVRLAQQVTEILSRPTAEGAVFRIDLRLRPQGNEGELAISAANALQYYATSAHDWERQALIKIRHSAGSESLAREFIRSVQPQVYQETVNFAAIKTALVSREKIDRRRSKQSSQTIDVKIDRGGIRDIEFLVQCLQRVYGGAEPWLRSGGTLFSLQKLHDKGHISGHEFQELTSAYTFLRHLEHRLQLRRGQQVHRLPAAAADVGILLRSIEGLSPENYRITDLNAELRERMAAVAAIYQRIIYQQQAQRSYGRSSGEFQLQSAAGSAPGDQSHQQMLEKLAEDAPELYRALDAERHRPVERKNVFRFLSSAYSTSERYGALVRDQKAIISSLPLFESSEYITEILVRHPEEISALPRIGQGNLSGAAKLFDSASDDHLTGRDPVFAYLATSNASHGEKIALLRRQFRHCMFVSGVRDVAELRPIYSSLAETTAAAEDALAAAFGIAESPRGLAVLALGRLGSREFDLLSDADLLFVCDEKQDRGPLTRSIEKIISALSAYTQEGMVFPVDTRLRPRGAEGELLVTPSQLEEYFASEAQSWEALTYTKLRSICGDPKLGRRTQAASEKLFQRFAVGDSFPAAVRQMRHKLQQASAPEKSIRTSAGGLYDTDFITSFLLVKHGLRPKTGTLRDRLWRCCGAGLITKADAAVLDHASELCRTVEHVLRLLIGRNSRWLPSAPHARQACEKLTADILRQHFANGLEAELLETFAKVREIYDRVVK